MSRPSSPAIYCLIFINVYLSCQSYTISTRVDVLPYDSYSHVNRTRRDCAFGAFTQSLCRYQWQQAIKGGLFGICSRVRCCCEYSTSRGVEEGNRSEGRGVCALREPSKPKLHETCGVLNNNQSSIASRACAKQGTEHNRTGFGECTIIGCS